MTTPTTREELTDALALFAAATDRRDWKTLREMLIPEARAYGTRGADAVVATMQAFLGGVGPTQHLLGNHRLLTPDPAEQPGPPEEEERVQVLSYGRVHHVGAGEMAGASYECLGTYDDTWVRRDGTWLLAHRWFEIIVEIGDPAVLRPAD